MINRLVLPLLLLMIHPANAEETSPKHPVEVKQFDLTVTSEEKPVEGAVVTVYACRCEEDPGSHYGWPSSNTDVQTILTTNKVGKVTIKWPVKFGSPENWKTLNQISMSIRHAEFVPDKLHVNPHEQAGTKELKSGCELTFSAVDSQRQNVPIGVVIAGPGGRASWLREDNGVVRSRAIPDGNWQTMLVSPREDGRHLFSGVLPIRLADGQDVTMRNLRLRPGLRLNGKVSDNVSRPVIKGRIQVRCIPKPTGKVNADNTPSLAWSDVMPIREDGTFEFSSLPRSGTMQFIAICDGWLGVNNDAPDRVGNRVQGTIVKLDDLTIADNAITDLEIRMEESGTVIVTVVKPDGQPLEGANVSTNPNQLWLLDGSTIVGARRRSIGGIRTQIDKDYKDDSTDLGELPPHYSDTTDQNGQATLSGIPLHNGEHVGAYHDEFIMPAGERGHRQREPYVCGSAEPVKVTIKMQAIEK